VLGGKRWQQRQQADEQRGNAAELGGRRKTHGGVIVASWVQVGEGEPAVVGIRVPGGDNAGMRFLPLWTCLCLWSGCAKAPPPQKPETAPARRSVLAVDHAEFTIENGRLVVPWEVEFEPGQATPNANSEKTLQHVAAFLAARPAITLLRIEGHGPGQGDAAAAQTLSEARALAVVVRLIELGVAEERLLPVGFGNHKPVVASGSSEPGLRNERIEFRPAAMRGRAIGGLPVDGGGKVAGRRG
jgi:OmpA-OmpF porin, OOP family